MLSSPSFKLLVLSRHASAGLSTISTHTGVLVLCASISLQVCCSSVIAITAHAKQNDELCKLYNACFMSKNVNRVALMFSNIFTNIFPPMLDTLNQYFVSLQYYLHDHCAKSRVEHDDTCLDIKWLLQALQKIHILKSFLQT